MVFRARDDALGREGNAPPGPEGSGRRIGFGHAPGGSEARRAAHQPRRLRRLSEDSRLSIAGSASAVSERTLCTAFQNSEETRL